MLHIAYGNLPRFLANVVAVVIGGAMWLCGLASITSMGRMWYAFARDDGFPGAALLKRVDARRGVPTTAIVVTSVIVFALPPNELVLWTMLLVLAALAVYWRASARHRFVGPRTSAGG